MGLLATNTIAQGDTREVGLDQLTSDSCVITRAVSSRKWPGAANLEVAHLWLRHGGWGGLHVLNEQPVAGITSYLVELGAAQGNPYRLAANGSLSFSGSKLDAIGFVLEPQEARVLLAEDARSRDVLAPYINGEDLNLRPDQAPSRWVIDFHDWPLERAESYSACMEVVRERVKPQRDENNRREYREKWWHYAEKPPALYATIADMEQVLVVPETTKHCAFSFCSTNMVISHMVKVIALDTTSHFALLSSTLHEAWARSYRQPWRRD
jgi:hypothetical protein